jgi:hypothetical protein
MSEQMNDFDPEVSQVASTSTPSPPAPADSEGIVSPPNASGVSPSSSPVRSVSVGARRASTQHVLRAVSVAGLLSLLIAVGLFVPNGNREVLVRFLTRPTPSPTRAPLPGDDAFLWEHFVPWGSLLVDGNPGPDVRSSALRQNTQGSWEGAAFHLPRGRHTLEYRAAPFPTVTCALSVPASPSDTCPLDRFLDSSLAPGAPATRVLDLQATLDRLPQAQADALVAVAQAQLNALAQRLGGGTLSAGDHFLDFTGEVLQVTTTVQLAPQFGLDTSIRAYAGLPCVTLCTQGDLEPASTSTGDWPVVASVMPTWRYTNAAGQVLLAEGPATPIGASPHTVISLLTRWQDGTWQPPTPVVEARQTDPVICPTAQRTLVWFVATTAPEHVDAGLQLPFAASTPELGCLLAGSATDPDTGNPSGPIAWVLYRAGALVAANTEAHRAFPTLPVASAHERALAQAVAPTSLT